MSLALPRDPGSSGEFQSRSVGPLPATITTPANGPPPGGLTSVALIGIASSCQLTSEGVAGPCSPGDILKQVCHLIGGRVNVWPTGAGGAGGAGSGRSAGGRPTSRWTTSRFLDKDARRRTAPRYD